MQSIMQEFSEIEKAKESLIGRLADFRSVKREDDNSDELWEAKVERDFNRAEEHFARNDE